MAKTMRKAGRVLAIVMVFALLFAASGTVFIGASAAETYGTTIYLKTDKTTTPYLHYWGTAGESKWPGVAMTKVDGETDVYSYELPYDASELTGVIFLSDGSGNKLTDDITNITGNLYTLSNSSWSMFDTNAIQITSFGADLESPQYVGCIVNLSIAAKGGDGNLQYKISVSGAASAVLLDYSSKNSVAWKPTVAGDYTVLFEVKDGSGESNSRKLSFTVKDVENAAEPVFLSATPANNSEIQKGGVTTVSVNGAGGKINTNLLFYKTEVLDPDGNRVNTVYYQTGNRISFNADKLGTYTVNMYIQNSSEKNTTVVSTYTYRSVNEPNSDTDSDEPIRVTGVTLDKSTAELNVGESTTLKATVNPSDADNKSVTWSTSNEKVATVTNGTVKAVAEGKATITVTTADGGFKATCEVTVKAGQQDSDTETVTDPDDSDSDTDTEPESDTDIVPGKMGDVDGDGKVTLKDASFIQRSLVKFLTLNDAQQAAADVDGDTKVTLKDASKIQRSLVGLDSID